MINWVCYKDYSIKTQSLKFNHELCRIYNNTRDLRLK
jgi:hypothetical protein